MRAWLTAGLSAPPLIERDLLRASCSPLSALKQTHPNVDSLISPSKILSVVRVCCHFAERRGLAMGLLTASSATGQLVFLPLLATVIRDHGWRAAALVMAAAAAIAVPIVALLLRERPADVGLPPVGAEALELAPAVATNPGRAAIAALGQGARSRDFWLLSATFFICGASTNGLIGTHLIPAAHGVVERSASSAHTGRAGGYLLRAISSLPSWRASASSARV
jgi:MFS family permease